MTIAELERKYAAYYLDGKRTLRKKKREHTYITVDRDRRFIDPRAHKDDAQEGEGK